MRLCIDCVHLLPRHTDEEDADERRKCAHPSALVDSTPSPVTGRTPPPYRITAGLNRSWTQAHSGHTLCGPDSKFFEPIELPGFR
jgi:hypothetical protein